MIGWVVTGIVGWVIILGVLVVGIAKAAAQADRALDKEARARRRRERMRRIK